MSTIVHFGYGDSAAGCLRSAIELGMPGDKVVVSRDDFTQGPIDDCIQDGGLSQRSEYWKNLNTLHTRMADVKDHYASTLNVLNDIESDATVVLWIGDSAHDILASAWLLTYFDTKDFDWQYIDLKEIEIEGKLEAVNAAMFTPEQIAKSYDKVSALDDQREEDLKALWSLMAKENSAYRIFDNGQVISVEEDYYDDFILSHITKKEKLLGKLMSTIMSEAEHRLTDSTIESRLAVLQNKKRIKIELNWPQVFTSKVKLK